LHVFQYGEKTPQEELAKYTIKVFYYPRNTSITQQFSTTPYITKSRAHPDLLKNLLADNHPILAEGLHCAAFFKHPKLESRTKILRMHNIEWSYYSSLADLSEKYFEKVFFQVESWRLSEFEKVALQHTDVVLAISKMEVQYFESKHSKVIYVPPFHPNNEVKIKTNTLGKYALFHGKLSVPDNEKVALFLIEEVFAGLDFPLIIAGREATGKLYQAAQKHPHISVQTNLSGDEMRKLQREAQMHVLWTFQAAGMKLKLLETLFTGRHCIVNDLMTVGTGVEDLCHIVENAVQLKNKIEALKSAVFSENEVEKRAQQLGKEFSNVKFAEEIKCLL